MPVCFYRSRSRIRFFELEVAAVENVKIVADKPGYGRVRFSDVKILLNCAKSVADSE